MLEPSLELAPRYLLFRSIFFRDFVPSKTAKENFALQMTFIKLLTASYQKIPKTLIFLELHSGVFKSKPKNRVNRTLAQAPQLKISQHLINFFFHKFCLYKERFLYQSFKKAEKLK